MLNVAFGEPAGPTTIQQASREHHTDLPPSLGTCGASGRLMTAKLGGSIDTTDVSKCLDVAVPKVPCLSYSPKA